MTATTSTGPRLLDALSLLSEVGDEVVVRSVRDTHLAWADRAHGLARRASGGGSTLPEVVHRGIAGAVYAGLGAGLRAASLGLDKLAETGVGPLLEDGPRGRFVSAAVNGLIGDRLLRERPDGGPPGRVRYTIVHVKKDGEWALESVRDAPFTPPSNYEHLRGLEWSVGDWASDGDKGEAERLSVSWSENRNFIHATFTTTLKGVSVGSAPTSGSAGIRTKRTSAPGSLTPPAVLAKARGPGTARSGSSKPPPSSAMARRPPRHMSSRRSMPTPSPSMPRTERSMARRSLIPGKSR